MLAFLHTFLMKLKKISSCWRILCFNVFFCSVLFLLRLAKWLGLKSVIKKMKYLNEFQKVRITEIDQTSYKKLFSIFFCIFFFHLYCPVLFLFICWLFVSFRYSTTYLQEHTILKYIKYRNKLEYREYTLHMGGKHKI